jgi:hypothetical protein
MKTRERRVDGAARASRESVFALKSNGGFATLRETGTRGKHMRAISICRAEFHELCAISPPSHSPDARLSRQAALVRITRRDKKRICVSACHAGTGCSPRSCASASHAGSPCSPHSCFSASRASTALYPCCTPHLPSRKTPSRQPPHPPHINSRRVGKCATRLFWETSIMKVET